ncbi:unnamed protein product [Penicillium salamii]|nr:unnamed protein product [Penicillium salamii]CAG8354176.1 unnamed protein product [Penicillium salamii]
MAPPTDRKEILARPRGHVKDKKQIVGAGAGMGLSAKSVESGGGDHIVLYNIGRFRMAGCGSLAGLMLYSNANDIVVEMAFEVIAIVNDTPFLKQLQGLGFAGVLNFPTFGLIDGTFRANLEETGMGFGKEVKMIRNAAEQGFLTTPYVFNVEDAVAMTNPGADVLVAHTGLTTSGTIGAQTGKTLEQCVGEVQAIRAIAVKFNPDIIVLCHVGPIAAPDDVRFMLEKVRGLHGFYGASSTEKFPVEKAIKKTTAEFKGLQIPKEMELFWGKN